MTIVKNTSIRAVPEPSGPPLRSMAELMNEASICGGAYHRNELPLEKEAREAREKKHRKAKK